MYAFKFLQKQYDLASLFKFGISVNRENSERLYLNGKGIKSPIKEQKKILSKAIDFYKCRIKTNEQGRVYAVISFENVVNKLDQNDVDLISNFDLKLEAAEELTRFYDEEDEVYRFLFLFNITTDKIDFLLKGKLNRHFGKDPYHMCEIFIMDLDLSSIVNMYDDRGIDYLALNIK